MPDLWKSALDWYIYYPDSIAEGHVCCDCDGGVQVVLVESNG